MDNSTTARPIRTIAREIQQEWGSKVNYAAKPYLQAMFSLDSIDDSYGYDNAKSTILYFLSTASSFRGEKAKALKAELKKIAGIK
jgi:hypothetical protein